MDTSERFKALVEEESKGNIKVDLRPAAGTEDEINLQTSMGIVDMQATGGPPLQVFAPRYFFFNGPYVIQDYEHFLRVWSGTLGDEARAEVLRGNGNMVALDTVYRGFRQMTSKVPIDGPADLVGLKLRLPVVPTWIKVWSALETAADRHPAADVVRGPAHRRRRRLGGRPLADLLAPPLRGAVAPQPHQPPGGRGLVLRERGLLAGAVATASAAGSRQAMEEAAAFGTAEDEGQRGHAAARACRPPA